MPRLCFECGGEVTTPVRCGQGSGVSLCSIQCAKNMGLSCEDDGPTWKQKVADRHKLWAEKAKRLEAARKAVGWNRRELVRQYPAYAEVTIRAMESGRRSVPDDLLNWIERLAKAHIKNPAPTRSAN